MIRTTIEKLAELKVLQKAVMEERRHKTELKQYSQAYSIYLEYFKTEPKRFASQICDLGHSHSTETEEYRQWVAQKPTAPKQSAFLARASDDRYVRHFNVLYGLAKGRSYDQIEQKVREGNKLSTYTLISLCTEYGIDSASILAELKRE